MKNVLFIVFLVFALSSCKIYSFTGANLNPEIQSISIAYINNKSGNGPGTTSDIFTNLLKDKMLLNTNLKMLNVGGDVSFSGNIVNYNYSIQAPSGNVTSDLKRITISVTIDYYNRIDEADGFEQQTFTRYADFPVADDLAAVEETIINEISTQLVDDIFNKAFVKW